MKVKLKEIINNLNKVDNKKKIVSSFSLFLLLIMFAGATYAYFQGQIGTGASSDINLATGVTDSLMFEAGDPIEIRATLDNFGQGGQNLKDDTYAKAILRANNVTNEAHATYNLYFIIEDNTLVYSTEKYTPELLFRVTDPTGKTIEKITGLKYTENGFDITTRSGSYLIVSDYEIETTGSNIKSDEWKVEVELVNLDEDQRKLMGKHLTGQFYITQEKLSTYKLIEINKMSVSPKSFSLTARFNDNDYTNGTSEVDKYYFAIEKQASSLSLNDTYGIRRLANESGGLRFEESDEPFYTFTDLDENSVYKVYSYIIDKQGMKSNTYETEVRTGAFTAPEVSNVTSSSTLNTITLNVSSLKGSNDIEEYWYSCDNGETWVQKRETTHTFEGLNDTSEYKIKVKIKDSEGRFSTDWYKTINTVVYVNPNITKIDTVTTYHSITVNPTVEKGMFDISKVMYSINDGEYQESNVFDGLDEQTEHTIRVKAIDVNNRETISQITATTDKYKVPVITSVTASDITINSFKLNVNVEKGDEEIWNFYYSINGTTWYVDSNEGDGLTHSHTFTELTTGVTFYTKVKVEDENGRFSTEYNLEVKTINTLKNITSTSYTGEIWGHKDTVTKIVLEDSLVAHPTATQTYDVSASQNGDIKAYLVSTGDNQYTAYIQADGDIVANPSSFGLFSKFSNVTAIEGLDKLDTSNVINMKSMFLDCLSLTSIDLSSWDTSKVTDMSYMFSGINNNEMSLTSINFGNNFDTSRVLTMQSMFQNCKQLLTLDLSMFDTSKVTDFQYMFYDCQSLTTLDLSNFNTSLVIYMNLMFYGCSSLTTLDVSSFNTSLVEDMQFMFSKCNVLNNLDVSRFDTSKVTNMQGMFQECQALTTLDLSKFNTSKVTDMSYMFLDCCHLTSLNLSNFDTSQVTDMSYMFSGNSYYMNVTSITFGTKWNTSNVTNMIGLFRYCRSLASLDVSKFYTSKVIDMSYMFRDCRALTTLDLSNFNTSNVTNMAYMFYDCSGLTTLNVSDFDTSKVTNMYSMFRRCSGLTTLDVSKFDTSQVTNMDSMFYECSELTTLDVSKFKTSNVTKLSFMFYDCNKLTTLDVSNWDTSKVTNMEYMFASFYNVMSLTSLDVSKFKTNNVISMKAMFYNCGELTTLDVSNFNTSNVTDIGGMFNECAKLTTLNVSNWDTSQVTNMFGIFSYCSELTTLDVSKWNTSKVTSMQEMFFQCRALTLLDVSNFDTSQVTNMSSMFSNCNKLTILNVSKFNTSQVTNMSSMFWGCSKVTTIDVSNFDTSKVTNMNNMFNGCNGLTSLNISKFDTSLVTDMHEMFSGCIGLSTLNVNNFDTSQVTNMNAMFSGCSKLTTIDLSNFNTSKVTDMGVMFMGCSKLTTLNLSSFDTLQVTNMGLMFYSCSSLTNLNIKNFDISNVTNYASMFTRAKSGIRITVKDSTVRTFIQSRLSDASISGTVVIG